MMVCFSPSYQPTLQKYQVIVLTKCHGLAELAGNFAVWLTSPEAHFLKGKFVWTNWDEDELKQNALEIEKSPLLTLGLEGASSFKY